MEIVVNFIERLIAIEDDPKVLLELDQQLQRAQRKLKEDRDANPI